MLASVVDAVVLYCYAIVVTAESIPRFVGPSCPHARGQDMEDHALYKFDDLIHSTLQKAMGLARIR